MEKASEREKSGDAIPGAEELVRNYGERVFNIAFRILGNHHDAEDVAQETFLSIYKKLDGFQGESSVYTWIYRITVNNCLKHKRKVNRIIQRSFDDSVDRDDQPAPDFLETDLPPTEKKLLTDELIYEIREKCHFFVTYRLTEEQRIVFILRDMFILSYKDIAYILDISEGVVKSRLSRARNRLKTHFKKNCYWYNPNNPCRCEKKIGYLISKYPGLLNEARKKADNPAHRQAVAEAVAKRDLSIDEIFRNIPMLHYIVKPVSL